MNPETLTVGDVVRFEGNNPSIFKGRQGKILEIRKDLVCLRFMLNSAIKFEGWFPANQLGSIES